MRFIRCKLDGAVLIIPEKNIDNRGFFARAFCERELQEEGIEFDIKQRNYSFNKMKGTLRGMHYQEPPFIEKKIVTCIKGEIYDVIIDIRKNSPTYLNWEGFILSEQNLISLYIPEGFAHGYITLVENSFLVYEMSQFYEADHQCGIKYDDPRVGINWPGIDKIVISDKDSNFKLLE